MNKAAGAILAALGLAILALSEESTGASTPAPAPWQPTLPINPTPAPTPAPTLVPPVTYKTDTPRYHEGNRVWDKYYGMSYIITRIDFMRGTYIYTVESTGIAGYEASFAALEAATTMNVL